MPKSTPRAATVPNTTARTIIATLAELIAAVCTAVLVVAVAVADAVEDCRLVVVDKELGIVKLANLPLRTVTDNQSRMVYWY